MAKYAEVSLKWSKGKNGLVSIAINLDVPHFCDCFETLGCIVTVALIMQNGRGFTVTKVGMV